MSTVYLDRNTLSIEVSGGHLEIRPAPRGRGSIPLGLISRLVLRGRIGLDSSTLAQLASRGIAVVCLGGRGHRRIAQISGAPGNDATRRVNQYRAVCCDQFRTRMARRIVSGKLQATLNEIGSLLERRPALRRPATSARRTLEHTLDGVEHAGLAALRGLEGAGAAAWYKVVAAALPASLNFTGRNRRPPRDPVNACLSLAYTMAHAEAVAECLGLGLDPMLGFLHEPAHGRESLACDLIEPLRPRIDARLLPLFSGRVLRDHHFSETDNGCRLKKSGRTHFYSWWENTAPAFRRYLRTRIHRLLNELGSVPP